MRMQRLGELNWLKIHGTAKGKGAIIAFTIDGLHPHDISTIIDRSGVAVQGRASLRTTVDDAARCDGNLPGVDGNVQYQGRDR